MDCVYSSWATDTEAGFRDDDVIDLCRLMPLLALTLKAASLARIAGTLVETYLGRDAGRRVLSGRIARGVADQIEAVLWFSDLRSYTEDHRQRRTGGDHSDAQRLCRRDHLRDP